MYLHLVLSENLSVYTRIQKYVLYAYSFVWKHVDFHILRPIQKILIIISLHWKISTLRPFTAYYYFFRQNHSFRDKYSIFGQSLFIHYHFVRVAILFNAYVLTLLIFALLLIRTRVIYTHVICMLCTQFILRVIHRVRALYIVLMCHFVGSATDMKRVRLMCSVINTLDDIVQWSGIKGRGSVGLFFFFFNYI